MVAESEALDVVAECCSTGLKQFAQRFFLNAWGSKLLQTCESEFVTPEAYPPLTWIKIFAFLVAPPNLFAQAVSRIALTRCNKRMMSLNTKISPDKENLASLNATHNWIPGAEDVRPTPEELQRKAYHMAYIKQTFTSEADFVLKMTLGLPSKRVKGLHLVDRTNLPEKKAFTENMFPYQVRNPFFQFNFTDSRKALHHVVHLHSPRWASNTRCKRCYHRACRPWEVFICVVHQSKDDHTWGVPCSSLLERRLMSLNLI